MAARFPMDRHVVAIAAAGALLGYVVEHLHRSAGVWSMPGDQALPPWILAAYFAGLLLVALLGRDVERRLGSPLVVTRTGAAVESGLLAAWFLAPPLLHRHELGLAATAFGALALRLALARAPGDAAFAAGVAALDLVAERSMVGAGLYRYTNAAHGALPLWLAPLWAGMGLSIRRLLAPLSR